MPRSEDDGRYDQMKLGVSSAGLGGYQGCYSLAAVTK